MFVKSYKNFNILRVKDKFLLNDCILIENSLKLNCSVFLIKIVF